MTPAWSDALAAGAAALGAPLDATALDRLSRFADLLLEWNKKMDLTSITDPDEVREKHFLDALAGCSVFEGAGVVVDLGSGPGVPGLVLAVARPDLQVVSVESKSKKGVFQRQVIRSLGLANAEVRTERMEEVVVHVEPPRWVTARALTDLDGLVVATRPWLAKGTVLVAYKSSKVDEEIAAAERRAPIQIRRRLDLTLPESGDPRTILCVSLDPPR